MTQAAAGGANPENPLGISGFEFIEFAAERPDELAAIFDRLGFVESARHRSRPWIRLFRQGPINLIINRKSIDDPDSEPFPGGHAISAFALQVADAGGAIARTLDKGAWALESHAGPMELVIPGINGVGRTAIFFVDCLADRTIYEVDFVPIANAASPAVTGLPGCCGVELIAHRVDRERAAECVDFYTQVLDLRPIATSTGTSTSFLEAAGSQMKIAIAVDEHDEIVAGSDFDTGGEVSDELSLLCDDIVSTVEELRRRGFDFEPCPQSAASGEGEQTTHLAAMGIWRDIRMAPSGTTMLRARMKPLIGNLVFWLAQRET